MSTEIAPAHILIASSRSAATALLTGFVTCLVPTMVMAGAFPAEISLADVEPDNGGDGSIGVYLFGATGNDEKGKSVASTGDLNGDGLADVLIGAPGAGSCRNCAAYIAFGGSDLPPSIDLLNDPVNSNGADAFIFKSLAPDDLGGQSISEIGDVNGDGIDDFMVGAPQAEPNGAASGRAYVVFGRSTGYPPVFDAQTLMPANGGDGSEGFVLDGIATNDQSGYAVSGGCDLNNDGVGDLVVGGAKPVPDKAHVVFGRTSGFPAVLELASLLPANGGDGSAGFEIDGLSNSEILGNAVGCLGDVNGDGIDDLALGALGGKNKTDPPGTVYLLFGRNDAFPPVLDVSDLLAAGGGDGSQGAVLHGIANGDDTGATVSDAGDVNDDGVDDIVIGAPHADSPNGHDSGRIYVVYGRPDGFAAEWDIADLLSTNGGDGSEGTVFNGIADGDWAGVAVSGAGDINGDGTSDLIIGAPSAHIPGMHTGVSYVVFGRAGGYAAEFELSTLPAVNGGDGSQGFLLLGASQSDISGTAVSGGSDVNGDGIDDIVIGAPDLDLHRNLVGKAYLVYGRPLDTDGDEVPDGSDNCTTIANEDQRDTDDDGFGNACDADFNGDCDTNFLDLGIMKQVFFQPGTTDTDMNGDGETNFLDLGMLKARFFTPPGPSGIPNICTP